MKAPLERFFFSAHQNRRIVAVILFCFAIYIALMVVLGYAWYADQWANGFRFFNDLPEWKQLDKVAHFFWAFQVSALAARLFSLAKLTPINSARLGAGLGLLFVSCVEIPDGFSEAYGASMFDILANSLGCLTFLLQQTFWQKIRVWPKFSFHPTVFAPLRPDMLGNSLLPQILKDYNGQTFWYSFSIAKLPLPSWLTLAVGVGAEGMIFGRDEQNLAAGLSPYRKFFLSVDLNLSQIETSSKWANSFLYVFRIIKFPAPAIEVSVHGIKFHPLYF